MHSRQPLIIQKPKTDWKHIFSNSELSTGVNVLGIFFSPYVKAEKNMSAPVMYLVIVSLI